MADITVGDFWGIEKITGKDDINGTSLLFSNSEQGDRLIDGINRDNFDIEEIPLAQVAGRASAPISSQPEEREKFWQEYEERGHESSCNSVLTRGLTDRAKLRSKKILRTWAVLRMEG